MEAHDGGEPGPLVVEADPIRSDESGHLLRGLRRSGLEAPDLEDVEEVRRHIQAHDDDAWAGGPPADGDVVPQPPGGHMPLPVRVERGVGVPLAGGDVASEPCRAGGEDSGAEGVDRRTVDAEGEARRVAGVVGDQPVEAAMSPPASEITTSGRRSG
jgi:hypothetical protein